MLTELSMINSMLACAGISGLTASSTKHPMYVKASAVLRNTSEEVQARGCWFNTTYPTLTRSASNEIFAPSNTLSIDALDTRIKVTVRGQRLYNLDTRNYEFEQDVKVKLIEALDLEDLPQTAKHYILRISEYSFYLDEDGTEPKLSNYRAAIPRAEAFFLREDLQNRDLNFFSGNNISAFLHDGLSYNGVRHRFPR